MTKADYNAEVNKHLGALEGIEETTLPCDKPCNVHDSVTKARVHEMAIIKAMARYTGNGMGQDIAQAVREGLQENRQVGRPINLTLPGGKIVTLTKQAIATWSFRVLLLAVITWLTTGKVDKAAIREEILAELKPVATHVEQDTVKTP